MRLTTPIAMAIAACLLSACGDGADTSDDHDDDPSDSATSSPSASSTPTEESDEPSEPSSEPPADGAATINGNGYSFTAPEGWSDQTRTFKAVQSMIDRAAAETKPREGFANNVNVIVVPAGPDKGKSLDELAPDLKREMLKFADEVDVLPRTELNGVEAHRQVGRATMLKHQVYIEQILAPVGDEFYIVTVTMRASTPPADRNAAAAAIIASWRWTEPPAV